jgi:N-methylhydantoinase B
MLDIPVKAGDVLTHIQPGAAGYGPPARRDLERILADVLDEKITAELAEREYGVLVDTANSRVVRSKDKPVTVDLSILNDR